LVGVIFNPLLEAVSTGSCGHGLGLAKVRPERRQAQGPESDAVIVDFDPLNDVRLGEDK
jgi:hypothetical protein